MTNPSETLRHYFEAYSAHDAEAVARLASDSIALRRPAQTAAGRDSLLATYQADWAGFPDCRIEVSSAVADGTLVFAEATLLGANNGPLHLPDGTVLPPTGRSIALEFVAAGEVDDGVVHALRVYWDNMDFMAQLGLLAGG